MYGFEWQNERGVEGTGFVRALRSLLTSHLPHFQPKIDNIIRLSLKEKLDRPGDDGAYTESNIDDACAVANCGCHKNSPESRSSR